MDEVACVNCGDGVLTYLGVKPGVKVSQVDSDYWKCPTCNAQFGVGRFVDPTKIAALRKTEPYLEEHGAEDVELFLDEDTADDDPYWRLYVNLLQE